MSRRSGFILAFIGLGIVMPSLVVSAFGVNKLSEVVEETTTTVEETVPSEISTFTVDYEQYGNMTIGDTFIRCSVVNNQLNDFPCDVYLIDKDTGEQITETEHLMPAGSLTVWNTEWSKDTVGKYEMTLVYDVITDAGNSVIECPYTVLVNK